jgi:hypothetical protein
MMPYGYDYVLHKCVECGNEFYDHYTKYGPFDCLPLCPYCKDKEELEKIDLRQVSRQLADHKSSKDLML